LLAQGGKVTAGRHAASSEKTFVFSNHDQFASFRLKIRVWLFKKVVSAIKVQLYKS
jgi:hypothetical protein